MAKSKVAMAKEEQNYQENQPGKHCRVCKHFEAALFVKDWGFQPCAKLRCKIGGFKVTPNAICDLFDRNAWHQTQRRKIMELNRPPILTIEETDGNKFEKMCKQLFEADYTMVTSSCGSVNSKSHQFRPTYQAIFQDKNLDA